MGASYSGTSFERLSRFGARLVGPSDSVVLEAVIVEIDGVGE